MSCILQVDFPYAGPWGEEMASAMQGLADSISQEPGFIWKVWTENRATGEAGGIYHFTDEASARAYLQMHTERLKGFGITGVNAKFFQVNEALTRRNGGSLQAAG